MEFLKNWKRGKEGYKDVGKFAVLIKREKFSYKQPGLNHPYILQGFGKQGERGGLLAWYKRAWVPLDLGLALF